MTYVLRLRPSAGSVTALWVACRVRDESGSSSAQDEDEEGLFSSSSVTGRHKGSGFPLGLPLRSHGQLDHSAGAD